MLNYISAEWYKLRHTKGIFIAFGLLLALIVLLFVPTFWVRRPTFGIYAGAYVVSLVLGFFLAPIFAARAFDDQYGRGTMKNELVFGIPRQRVYLGKLAFGGLLGAGAAFLVLAFYLAMCALMGGLQEENALACIDICVQGTILVLPLWLASLSLAFLLQVAVKNSAGAITINYLLLLFLVPISLVGTDQPTSSHVFNFINRWFFAAPFRKLYETIDLSVESLSGMTYSWLVGLGWIAVTTLVGIVLLSRKEIG